MSEKQPLDFYADDFPLFIEAGFIAIKQLDEIAARRLFKAAELLRPDNSAPKLGLGYIELNKMRATEASRLFEKILEKEPDHCLAKALLGVSYLMTKDKRVQGEALINEVKGLTNDPTIQNLAEVSMQWTKKDLRSQSVPFGGVAQEKKEIK